MNKKELSALRKSLAIVPPTKRQLERKLAADRPTHTPSINDPRKPGVSATERKRAQRQRERQTRVNNIAILDMETDPFDAEKGTEILPFLAVLYSDNFDPIIIWEEDNQTFIHKVITAIENLPERYTIYAHNGGKFDFMFLISRIRGNISFKGRGIMKATIGNHELRDSFHIIPEKLAAYQKDAFDYQNLRRGTRDKFRKKIIEYCVNDCKYLLDIVKGFVKEFGLKLSIGQAALAELKKTYKYETLSASMDEEIRKYFFGGRVECLQGRGLFSGDYKLYDVNSMYPAVMANMSHPIGNKYLTRAGEPNAYTCFIDLECLNFGALVQRRKREDGTLETTTRVERGRFFTTIHEYRAALELGLIANVKINFCVDNNSLTTFSEFIRPIYNKRLETKRQLAAMKKAGVSEESPEFLEIKKNDIFLKLLMNNAYGKFAQNPRRYKEHFITAPQEWPDESEGFDTLPSYMCKDYWIFEKAAPPERMKFNNVGTAASITGAARSVLMRAIANATDAVYCDTDSLICRAVKNVEIDATKLGAWDLEAEFSEVIINGKKMYACKPKADGKPKIRSKGVAGLSYDQMRDILNGSEIEVRQKGVTLTKTGNQYYMTRRVRATAA